MPDFSGLLPDPPGREVAPLPGGADRALAGAAGRRAAKRQRAALVALTSLLAAVVAVALDGDDGRARLEFVGNPPIPSVSAGQDVAPGAARTATPQPTATADGRTPPGRAAVQAPGATPSVPGGPAPLPPPADTVVRDDVADPGQCAGSQPWCVRAFGPAAASSTGRVPLSFGACRPALAATELRFDGEREVDVVVWRDADEDGRVDPGTGPAWTWARDRAFGPRPHAVAVGGGRCARWTVSWDLVEDGGRPAAGGYLVTFRVAIRAVDEGVPGADPQERYEPYPLVVGDEPGCAEECAAAAGTAAPGPVVVEAEDGSIDTPLCGDDGPMRELANTDASGGALVFHPGADCTQTFAAGALRDVRTIRYYTTGGDQVQCGYFLLTGGIVGATPLTCSTGAVFLTVPVSSTVRVGAYSITWVTDPGTPSYVNAFVDVHTGG